MLEAPEIWGIESISADAIVLRLVVKTRTGAKDEVARELRLRVKRALDTMGVRVPALNVATSSGGTAAGTTETPVIPGIGKQPATKPAPTVGGKK
jgi:small conductance mechanosensitive channel